MLDPLVPYSRKLSYIQTAGSSQMQQKVAVLEQQIEHLSKIIIQKDDILNFIMLAFQSAQYKHNMLTRQLNQYFSQLEHKQKQTQYFNNKSITSKGEQIKKLTEIVLQDLQKVLQSQRYFQPYEQQANKVLSLAKGEQFERQSNDTSLEQNDSKKIYEVPIQMVIYRDLAQSTAQADIELSRSLIYEIPIQFETIEQIPVILDKQNDNDYQFMEMEREIYTVSVQIDQIYEIPGELNQFTEFLLQQNDQIIEIPKPNNSMAQNVRLNNEISSLQEQIKKLKQQNQQLSLKEDKVITIEVPVRVVQLVQTPIELQPFEVNYIQQSVIEARQVQTQTDQLDVVEQSSKIIYEKEIIVREVPIEVVVQRLVQIPTQVEIQRIVEVSKIQIRQIPIEVVIQKQIYVQFQKIIPIMVPIIKEVPIQVQVLNKLIQIQRNVPIFVPIVKEIPIQIQIQIETVVVNQVKTLVEVPVIVYLQSQKLSSNINTQSQYETLSEYSCKLHQESNFLLQSKYQIYSSNPPVQKCKVFQLPIELELQKVVQVEKIIEKQVIVQKIVQVIVEKEIQKVVEKEVINYVIKQVPVECIAQLPVQINQTLQNSFEIPQKQVISQQNNTVNVQPFTVQQQITIYELPIELELVQNQVKQRYQQLKYQQYLNFMKQKYQNEINQLHSLISQMECIIQQKNGQSLLFQQKIQNLTLKIEEIQSTHHKIQKRQKITIYQLPIQVNLTKNTIQVEIQTQDMELFQHIQFIEVPLQIENAQEITIAEIQQEIQQTEEQQQIHFLQPILEQQRSDIKKIQSQIIQNQQEGSLSLTNSGNFLARQISHKQFIYQIPVQIYTVPQEYEITQQSQVAYQPQVYEVPVLVNLIVDNTEVQVQTDFQQNKTLEQFIYEVPVQILQIEQVQEQIQPLIKEQKLGFIKVYQFKITTSKTEHNIIQLKSGFIKESLLPSVKIYELPIQLLVVNKQYFESQITTNTCQTENKILSIVKQIEINEQFKLVLNKKEQNSQKQSIFNNIENIISPAQLPNTPRQSQGKLQNKIIRLGSDITLNFHNSSQVQSLTPGMFASQSSYQKFPPPQINNISLIKKDSFSQGKFFGSLDIREEILNRDDAIAQIREANRKLTGFQHQSSEGDSHNQSREMIIEQNETIVSKDINRIQTPNLEPHDLNFSQYAKFQDKNYQNEQQHQKYIQQNQLLNSKITKLNKQLQKQREDLKRLESLLQEEQQKHQNIIENLKVELAVNNKQKEVLQIQIQQYKNIIEQKQQCHIQLQKRNDIIAENYQKLKYEAIRQQKEVNNQVERLHNLVLQKQNQVRDAKLEAVHHKKIYDRQINQLREYLIVNKEQIEKLYEQIQNKNEKIDQLQGSLQQLRKSITLMKHFQTDTSVIYEQQFQRIRNDFEQQKRQRQHLIEKLQTEIEQLNIQLMNESNKNKEQLLIIDSLQRSLQEMKIQYSKLHHLKSQIEDEYIIDIKQLKGQIEHMKTQIVQKEELIKQNAKINVIQPMEDKNKQQMKIQFIQETPHKKNEQNLRQLAQYTQNLQSIILNYEEKLIINHNTIQQLQEKVCEYLNDALEKQQQAENLYLKLISFENTINDLLIQKVSLELQNRKQVKHIEQAEKKLKLLGNRLIQFARQRAQYDSADEQECQE